MLKWLTKVIYMTRNEFHPCELCKDGKVCIEHYKPYTDVETKHADEQGRIYLVCPECKGSRIIWGYR